MTKPTCFVRFDPAGKPVVWMRCLQCGGEVIIHPQRESVPRPWTELPCESCGKTARELGASDESTS